LKSTLSSSGIFIKTLDSKFYFKEREAVDYIIKASEKVLTKKMEKKDINKSISTKSSLKSKKKK
jgi:hypothetical protein